MIVTISGRAGSGKSTIAKLIAEKLNLKHYSTGDLMRDIAKERGISLAELGKIAEKDKELDTQLDKRQEDLGKNEDNFVIDGRLSFHFIPDSIKIFLDINPEIAVERVYNDIKDNKRLTEKDSQDKGSIAKNLQKREASETARYAKYYGLDCYDQKQYDLIIDTGNLSIEKIVDKALQFIKKRNAPKSL